MYKAKKALLMNKAKEALRILSPEDIESIKEYNITSKGGKV